MATVQEGSVAPPGWAQPEPVSASALVSLPSEPTAQAPADAAVRWRISAAIIDNILVYVIYLLVCLLLHWQVLNLEHLLALVAIDVLYHFALESRDGQTVGKRQYGLRVLALDDQPATRKAIAMRSLLRIIDQLPTWYLSGLVSMVRTGPERRQRIGDVAAATKVVVVEGRFTARGTPGWMLPVATLVALAFSAALAVGVANAGHEPLTSAQASQWVASCESSSNGLLDCQCALARLEADGYDTVDNLNSLLEQAESERLSGQPGQARDELTAVVLACHH